MKLEACILTAMDICYQPVRAYYRQRHFDFYRDHPNPFYAVTFELEAGPLKAFSKQHGLSVYLNLCYLFTRAMQDLEAFRYRLLDGELVLYSRIHPSMIVPLVDGGYCFARPAYDDDLFAFHEAAEPAIALAKRTRNLANEPFHNNYIFYSSLPQIPFTGLTHVPLPSTTAAEPCVSFGKITEREGKHWVPVGIQVNHIFIDGLVLGELVERAGALFREPGR